MRRACVIGWPVDHSRSPLIHNTWLQTYAIDGAYTREAVKPDNVGFFLTQLAERGYVGCNVTVPHKEAALTAADVTDAAAQAIGAVNTIWIDGEKICATNTDSYGYMTYLNAKAPNWKSASGTVAVIGAGGASRAIVHGLLEAGAGAVRLINRTHTRAEDVAAHFGSRIEVVTWQDRNKALEGTCLVVNTTSLGMNGNGMPDIDLSVLADKCVVSDIVYTPLATPLLKAAKARGLKTVDGLGMLIHQAVPGFEKWFGVRPEVTDELYQSVANELGSKAC